MGASIDTGNMAFGGLGPDATAEALSDRAADDMLDCAGKV